MAMNSEQGKFGTEVELARLAAIVSSSSDAIVSKNLNGIVNSWNAAAERIFGFLAAEMIGRSIKTIIPPELQSEEDDIIGRIKRGERLEHYDTVRLRKDGSRVNVSITVSPLRDGQGNIVGASKIARDVTERKQHEETQSILVHELNHRTKNLLATVQAIALRTLTGASPESERLFRNRVRALSASQDLLTKNGWRGASLSSMFAAVLAPFVQGNTQISIALGPNVHLDLRQTNALSMAVHELATNAIKYGALSTPTGLVQVGWEVENGNVSLSWRESGGPEVLPPKHFGFGNELLTAALKYELKADANLDFRPTGLNFSVRLPLSSNEPKPNLT